MNMLLRILHVALIENKQAENNVLGTNYMIRMSVSDSP